MLRAEGVVIGDYGVGKTSFLYSLLNKKIPDRHVPTILETYCVEVTVKEDVRMEMVLHDTPGCQDYMQFAQMSLVGKDFVLLCFSLVIPSSFKNVTDYWLNQIRTKLPNVPVVLVGTQLDLRNTPSIIEDLIDRGTPAIERDQGQRLADEIGAIQYIECSAHHNSDNEEIRKKAAQIAYEFKKKNKKEKCVIL